MIGRYILVTLGILAIAWTTYVSIDLIDKEDDLAPQTIFGLEDKELLMIHRPDEFSWDALQFRTTFRNKELLGKVTNYPDHLKTIYISSTRSHLILEASYFWTRRAVKSLFKDSGLNPKFDGLQSFSIKNFTGKIYRNRLYLTNKDYSTNPSIENWIVFDRKSSASHLIFREGGFEITDLYFKEDGRVDYVMSKIAGLKGAQVNDKELFAAALPSNLENYHFYEKHFLEGKDETFRNSPMKEWIDKGFVLFDIKGTPIIITDFKESQDPVNSMFDFVKQDPDNQEYGYFQNIELMDGFPQNPEKGIYVYNMDNYAVISGDQRLCEELVANFRLGNTLIKDQERMTEIWGKLPARVSERFCSKESMFSFAVYNERLLKTVLPAKRSAGSNTPESDKGYTAFNMGGNIHDIMIQAGSGSFLAVTSSGKLRSYRKGERLWEKNLNSEPIGKIARVKWRELPYFLITTKNAVHLIDEEGNSPAGFPAVASDKQIAAQATVYTWKGRTWVLVVNSSGDVLVLNQGGRREAVIKTGLGSVSDPVDVWVSQRKVFYGVRGQGTFKMYEADSRREFRSFNLPSSSLSLKVNNELFLFGIEGGELSKTDQKGNRTSFGGGWSDFTIDQVVQADGKIWIILHDATTVKLVDDNGRNWYTMITAAQEIEAVTFNFEHGAKSLISVVDGLENDVYLYGLNGQLIGDRPFEGSKLSAADEDALGTRYLTTVVDGFVVQHSIK